MISKKYKECYLFKDNFCTERGKHRDCERPLCCGICPTRDWCENLCGIICEEIDKEDD